MQLREHGELDESQLLRLMLYLQRHMDYDNLATILLRLKREDVLFAFFYRRELAQPNKRRAIVDTFKECLRMDDLAVALQIWKKWEELLTTGEYFDTIAKACVSAFGKSPDFLEPKTYFVMQLLHLFRYEHIDRILTSMEKRFGEIAEDGSNSYLLCNLNPVKTACHMLMLLSQIEQKYSLASLRTQGLSEIIVAQAKSVLDQQFFPLQMRYQLKQIDLMNRNALYYLEHLDAFELMETHILDRVLQEHWQSDLDASGSFLGASSSYGILRHLGS